MLSLRRPRPAELLFRLRAAAVSGDTHGDAVSVARALVFLAGAGTLLAEPVRVLLAPEIPGTDRAALGTWHHLACHGYATLSGYCVTPSTDLGLVRLLFAGVLLAAAAGYRPRLLAIPAWWVIWSAYVSIWARDGGDRVQEIVALLLIVVGLTDGRRWAWRRIEPSRTLRPGMALACRTVHAVLAVQVAVIYVVAGVAKLSERGWRDGSSLHYWSHDLTFGLHGTAARLLPLMDTRWIPFVLAWSTMLTELSLALGVFLPRRLRRYLLIPGVLLHLAIAVSMGLTSFAMAMWAALTLYCWPLWAPPAPPASEGSLPAQRAAESDVEDVPSPICA